MLAHRGCADARASRVARMTLRRPRRLRWITTGSSPATSCLARVRNRSACSGARATAQMQLQCPFRRWPRLRGQPGCPLPIPSSRDEGASIGPLHHLFDRLHAHAQGPHDLRARI
eukprot:2793005-Pyramimonas_sp.AAC.2